MQTSGAMRTILAAGYVSPAVMVPMGAAWATPLNFDFSYNGGGVSASGVLTTNGVLSNGAYVVTAISGSRNGTPIEGLYTNHDPYNLLASAPYVDQKGIHYMAGSDDSEVFADIFELNGTTWELSGRNGIAITLTVTPVKSITTPGAMPEPWSVALLGTGVIGFAVLRRRQECCQSRIDGWLSKETAADGLFAVTATSSHASL